MNTAREEELAQALARVSRCVPLAQYDDVLKPLEKALVGLLSVVEQQRQALEEIVAMTEWSGDWPGASAEAFDEAVKIARQALGAGSDTP